VFYGLSWIGMSAVVQNLASLSRIAKNTLGFTGQVIGPNVRPTIDVTPAKKWAEVQTGGGVSVRTQTQPNFPTLY